MNIPPSTSVRGPSSRTFSLHARTIGALIKSSLEIANAAAFPPVFRTSRVEYLRITAGMRNQASISLRYPQQPQDLPLQPGQLRGEDHRRALSLRQLVPLHVLEQVDHPPCCRATARPALGVQRQALIPACPSPDAAHAPGSIPPTVQRITRRATPEAGWSPSGTQAPPRNPSSASPPRLDPRRPLGGQQQFPLRQRHDVGDQREDPVAPVLLGQAVVGDVVGQDLAKIT